MKMSRQAIDCNRDNFELNNLINLLFFFISYRYEQSLLCEEEAMLVK